MHSHSTPHRAANDATFTEPLISQRALAQRSPWASASDEILRQDQLKVRRDEIKPGTARLTRIRLQGAIAAFFEPLLCANVEASHIEQFVSYLTNLGFCSATISGYLSLVKRLLRQMHAMQYLQVLPTMPTVTPQLRPRGAFTLGEYWVLLRASRRLQGHVYQHWGDAQRPWIRCAYRTLSPEMTWLMRFMVHSFVRPGEIRQLQHQHIEVVRSTQGGISLCYRRLTSPQIKRHGAPVIGMPSAVHAYEQLRAYHKKLGFGEAADFVFLPELPNRQLALDTLGWQFNWLLEETGLKKGPHGVARTLYSLRHTAITFRLIYGASVDLLTLARNARTSVEMIEKFYASTLSAEMNVVALLAKRR